MARDVAHWIAQLNSTDLMQKAQAAESLARLGDAVKPAAVALAKEAGSADETVREWVVSALESLGPPRPGDVESLKELVASEREETAYWAITLLGRLESIAAPAVPELIQELNENPHPHNRQRAAWALGKIGPAAAAALPDLKAAAHSPDRRMARIALLAIQSISESEQQPDQNALGMSSPL